MSATIPFLSWLLSADADATRQAYAMIAGGGADTCLCTMCRNFLLHRAAAYPMPVRELFGVLGVDGTKEAESYHMCRVSQGRHLYGWWLHFAGSIVEGADSITWDESKSVGQIIKTPVTSRFKIGLANMFSAGQGVARDPARARELYRKACDAGSGMGCSSLAKAFLAGEHIPLNVGQAEELFSRSVKLLQRACDDGSTRACGQVGWLYQSGHGTRKDEVKALHFYQIGCDGNDSASCYNLAVNRQSENPKDPAIRTLFERACTLGLSEACKAQEH